MGASWRKINQPFHSRSILAENPIETETVAQLYWKDPGRITACPEITCLKSMLKNGGRGERIRTSDSCVPNAVLYQAELHPETTSSITSTCSNHFKLVGSNCTQEGVSGQIQIFSRTCLKVCHKVARLVLGREYAQLIISRHGEYTQL